jgi:hypothetical protein
MAKVKKVYTIVLFTLLLIGCDKDSNIENLYDCTETIMSYSVNSNPWFWSKNYFLSGILVKTEYSNGDFCEYDSRGNVIVSKCGEYKYFSEFNDQNKVIREDSYQLNHIKQSTYYEYRDTLLLLSYTLDSSKDTVYKSNYYYNISDKLDSVNSINSATYYYYLLNQDSIVRKNLEGQVVEIQNWKYSEYKKIHEEYFLFGDNKADIYQSCITVWEYNTNRLISRKTYLLTLSVQPLQIQWGDTRYFYNCSRALIRTEKYDIENILRAYSTFVYEHNELRRIDFYNPNNELTGYTVYDKTCN